MKRSWPALLATLAIVFTAGVYFTAAPRLTNPGEAVPSVVRVGVLPDMNAEDLRKRYRPLLKYLSNETGLEFRLVLPADYAELLHLFRNGEVDLALFGGLTFVQASSSSQAQPLVMRDVDTRFVSMFVVRQDDTAIKITDLKSKVLAFGSRLSTSGHLMPRYYLRNEWQITPEQFFDQIVYSGAHDKTAYMVLEGKADIGAVNAEIIRGMLRDGRLKQGDLRVIWETPPYADYVWAVPRYLDEGIKTQLRDAYLQLDMSDEHHRKVLEGLGAQSFLPAGSRVFQPLRNIAANVELVVAE